MAAGGEEPDPITEPEAAAAPRLAADEAPPFRFSRVRPKGRAVRPGLIEKLAEAMTQGVAAGGDVPAGYTYLGQFIDHDLTMDVTQVSLGEEITPAQLLQGALAELDLDSLYGAGPADEESAKFYEDDGLHLKTGTTIRIGADREKVGHDLPRVSTGPTRAKRRALIPDPATTRT